MDWPGAEAADGGSAAPPSPRRVLAIWAVFTLLTLGVEWPALRGPFVSDDTIYLVFNRWVQELSFENVRAIVDPFGPATAYTANWAPVHLLLHAVEWRIFGQATLGYHLVNVVLHSLVSALLVPLFVSAGVSEAAALAGGLLFLLHPANVEAVAWISQLKTLVAMAFAVGALLAHPRRPVLAAALFALGLLGKALAAFALPVVAWAELERWRRGGSRAGLGWVALWTAIFALYAVPQLWAFGHLGDPGFPLASDCGVAARTVVAIVARYAAMAATSYGVAAFHDPARALSPLDPWFLAGVALLTLAVARALWTLWQGTPEAGWWVWCAAAYLPVSQLRPFLYPMGDRYVYFVLPGLVGALLLSGGTALRRWARSAGEQTRSLLSRAGLVATVALLVVFAARSSARATIWRSDLALFRDSARAYPTGLSAELLRAREAAQAGDVDGVVAAVRAAEERGFDRYVSLLTEPAFASVRSDPRFRALVAEVAGRWLATAEPRHYTRWFELRWMADAHAVREEWQEAEALLERALAVAGSQRPQVEQDLVRARARLAEQERASGADERATSR